MATIVFAGGGTGGHLFPGVAVAEELTHAVTSCKCLFVGSDRSIEKHILDPCGFEHVPLPVSSSASFLKSPLSSALSHWRAYRTAYQFLELASPSLVMGLGGLVSVPLVIAAWRRKIPVVLLEQNAIIGRANRVLLPFAHQICLSYLDTPLPSRYRSIATVAGNPVRRGIRNGSARALHTAQKPTLLVLGGSQGARAVNTSVLNAFPQLKNELRNWRIVHQTGTQDFDKVKAEYARVGISANVSPFLHDLGSIYPQTALAISRAGGTTLAELALHAIPSVVIPYPGSIRDHQVRNAEQYAHTGGAILLPQSADCTQTTSRLRDHLQKLLTRDDLRATMQSGMSLLARPQAARTVADLVFHYCSVPHSPGLLSSIPEDASGTSSIAHNGFPHGV